MKHNTDAIHAIHGLFGYSQQRNNAKTCGPPTIHQASIHDSTTLETKDAACPSACGRGAVQVFYRIAGYNEQRSGSETHSMVTFHEALFAAAHRVNLEAEIL
jgi:hypothetical protein